MLAHSAALPYGDSVSKVSETAPVVIHAFVVRLQLLGRLLVQLLQAAERTFAGICSVAARI